MKIRKIMTFVVISIIGFALLSCGNMQDDNENETGNDTENNGDLNEDYLVTKYYLPQVESTFNKINEEDFINKFNEALDNIKINNFDYQYVGAVINYQKPVAYHGIEIDGDYVLGKTNDATKITSKDDLRLWLVSYWPRYASSIQDYGISEFVLTRSLIENCYDVEGKINYYEKPYAVEYEKMWGSTAYNIKIVFDEEFLVESIIASSDENTIKIKFQYFNEIDLPTASGKIDINTYQEIACVRTLKEVNDLTQVNVKFTGENMVLSLDTIYDENSDTYLSNPKIGNLTADLHFKLIKMPTKLPTNCIISYQRMCDKISITSGEAGDMGRNTISEIVQRNYTAYDSSFIVPIINGKIDNNYEVVYTNSPLTASISLNDESLFAKFNDFGAITKYIYYNKETGCKYTSEYSYS